MQISDEWVRWFVGGILTNGAVVIGAYINLKMDINRIKIFLLLNSKNAAKALHSPDDHLGIDKLLDKYIHNHDLTQEEWVELKYAMDTIIHDPSKTPGERSLAGQLAAFIDAFCDHKLKAYLKYIAEREKRDKHK